MPLLAKEPDLYPVSLFDLDAAAAPWFVAYVHSRCEKALARHLFERRVPFYLPQYSKQLIAGDRQRISRPPLFPGYVFLRGGRGERLTALRSQRIVRLIEVDDQERLGAELAELRHLEAAGFLLVPLPYLDSGDTVEIQQGAFRGYRGVVTRTSERERLTVSVTFLRRSVSVEMSREAVRSVAAEAAGRSRSRVA